MMTWAATTGRAIRRRRDLVGTSAVTSITTRATATYLRGAMNQQSLMVSCYGTAHGGCSVGERRDRRGCCFCGHGLPGIDRGGTARTRACGHDGDPLSRRLDHLYGRHDA